jgi:hypothetical protein
LLFPGIKYAGEARFLSFSQSAYVLRFHFQTPSTDHSGGQVQALDMRECQTSKALFKFQQPNDWLSSTPLEAPSQLAQCA